VMAVGTQRLGCASGESSSISQGDNAQDIACASRIVTASRLAVAARDSRLRWEGPAARAFGVLVVAESEPAILRRDVAIALCLNVARALSGAMPTVGEISSTTTQSRLDARRLEASARRGLTDETAPERTATDSSVGSDEPLGDQTEYAGLLFLLNAAVDAAMPDALLNDRSLDSVAPAVLLARTAMALAPVEPDDPVVFAFAGVDPRRTLHRWNRSLNEPLMERICVHASTWAAAAARRLGHQDEASLAVVTEKLGRTGRIVREPGWLEVHLSLDDVDIDVRRAGLDLDPGWVPWLGSVLRFRYA
jgi:hypothetical protein